jgi:mannitol 2-dehydrogenase
MPTRPSLNNLSALSAVASVPAYARKKLSAGIVHIGVGNFHRAHMAHYLHRLFDLGRDHDWAIIGAGVKSFDSAMRECLKPQDWLTTVVELDPAGFSATVTGAMIDFTEATPGAILAALLQPEIRIVSLTITEGGYFVDALTGGFDAGHPDIRADAADPAHPRTVFGIIIAALRHRRDRGLQPFTVLSCDNLPENGRATSAAVIGLARLQDSSFAGWIARNVAFPNSMVDCITPATGGRERKLVLDRFGIEDAAPVVCEPFRQWVLEDRFPQGRPAFELVGAQFVADVAPYELMKLRILNGGHATIAYPSGLLGIHYVHEAMAHPLVARFLDWLEHKELMPTVPAIAGVDFETYYRKIVERFSNPAIGDTVARLCLDGSNRQPKFILPAVRDRLKAGLPVDGLALEVALWCRFCAGTDDAGNPVNVPDDNAATLTAHALKARKDPAAFLSLDTIFGDLAGAAPFAEAFGRSLDALWSRGVVKVLEEAVDRAENP